MIVLNLESMYLESEIELSDADVKIWNPRTNGSLNQVLGNTKSTAFSGCVENEDPKTKTEDPLV